MLQKRQNNRMGNDFKAEARKQYFKYFRIWFIIVAVLLVITIFMVAAELLSRNDSGVRNNDESPIERVYDYAEVLTDEEEQELRILIAKKETEIQADIVLVTINEPMEKDGISWETAMMNYADDFYDNHNYGYNKVWGNGVLLLDNYYEGQAGSWLSTCGNVYEKFGNYEINRVLDAVYYGLDDGAYNAYSKYVYTVCDYMQDTEEVEGIPFIGIFIIPTIVAVIYACIHLFQAKAKDTTNASTYVAGGRPVMKVQRDDFIRKSVTKRRIESSSSSSGGGSRSSGGRGGSHRSSSGVSHGGGGRRR